MVIGGSAGAFEPLRCIFARLPADLPAAIFIVLHLGEGSKYLPGIIADDGPIAVQWAKDKAQFKRGCGYVAAPDHHLLLIRDHMRLTRGPRENHSRPAIDVLFRSAAVNNGPRVIGVLLSGYQNDGAAGLVAIKERGGIAIVQDPLSADTPDMPSHALAATSVDHVANPAEIALLITDLVNRPAVMAMSSSNMSSSNMSPPNKYDLEVRIAEGEILSSEGLKEIADPAPLTCPDCGGVLSQVKGAAPLRFRCQIGHAITADALLREQEDPLRGAMRSSQRLIEEHVDLLGRMAADARAKNRGGMAALFEARREEYHRTAQIIRRALSVPAATSEVEGTAERGQAVGEATSGAEPKRRATLP